MLQLYLDSDKEGIAELVIEAIIKVGSLKFARKRQTTVTNFFKTSNASVLFVCFKTIRTVNCFLVNAFFLYNCKECLKRKVRN